ncbi:MAG: hypothetical protein Q9207_003560 [Kuettlingeria erythrocarpa]
MSVSEGRASAPGASSIPEWVVRSRTYGDDHAELAAYIRSVEGRDVSVEVIEVDSTGSSQEMRQHKIKAFSVNRLSGELLKILGAKFDMDYETWTSRILPSDREYFATSLNQRGTFYAFA